MCDRMFFPARLSKTLDPKLARRISAAVNSKHGDDYITLDARVHIDLDADHSGGILTVMELAR